MADTLTLPEADIDTDTESRRQPPYAVILHNDDLNGFEFVIGVLNKVFRYPMEKCVKLTLEAHENEISVVWVGSLEVAELKADQIHSCGADPAAKAKGAQPLKATVEEV